MFIHSARQATGMDAIARAGRGQELSASEICLNSIDSVRLVRR
ncbi:hypothetical protein [Streptomyces achromogenes]